MTQMKDMLIGEENMNPEQRERLHALRAESKSAQGEFIEKLKIKMTELIEKHGFVGEPVFLVDILLAVVPVEEANRKIVTVVAIHQEKDFVLAEKGRSPITFLELETGKTISVTVEKIVHIHEDRDWCLEGVINNSPYNFKMAFNTQTGVGKFEYIKPRS
jgi:hypothetical protein